MRTLVAVLAFVFALADTQPKPAIPYFSNVRGIAVKKTDAQNYVVVDNAVWLYARNDLGDLRLYRRRNEMPYALTIERGASDVVEAPAKLFNLGRVQGTTQFIIDTTGVPEYDQARLNLSKDAVDFITRVNIEGTDDWKAARWTDLGTHPLYDFSREKLGSNTLIKLPLSRFRYLRFAVTDLAPEQIVSATLATTNEEKARWTDLRVFNQKTENIGRRTIITWTMEGNAPVDRLQFVLDPYEVNFRRPVDVIAVRTTEDGRHQQEALQSGTISRIHFQRKGNLVDSEELTVPVNSYERSFKVIVENGDDLPLRIQKIQPQAYERRMYFDPRGAATLSLYYGDSKLAEPVYDYGKLFARDSSSVAAEFGPPRANPEYTPRPDDRPWSERHGWVTWAALVVAVLGLAVLALRGMKSENARAAAK